MKDNTDRNFKGQMENEEVLCFCRKHWIIVVHYLIGLPVFWLIFLAYVFFIDKRPFIDFFSPAGFQILSLVVIIAATYLHHRIFIKLLDYFLQIMVVTNFRVIELDKTIFFRDSRNALDLKEIQDLVMKKDGVFRTVFDYGDIDILLSSVVTPHSIRFVPNPEYHFRKINKSKREYIVSRQQVQMKDTPPKEPQEQFYPKDDRYPAGLSQDSQVESTPFPIRKET